MPKWLECSEGQWGNMWQCATMCNYSNFINTSWTSSVLDQAVVKTGNIPSLAFCCEITSFPPGRFVRTKVVVIYSLCPTYWEATTESWPCSTWSNVTLVCCFKIDLLQLIWQIIIIRNNSYWWVKAPYSYIRVHPSLRGVLWTAFGQFLHCFKELVMKYGQLANYSSTALRNRSVWTACK